jgi:hypothetical protein
MRIHRHRHLHRLHRRLRCFLLNQSNSSGVNVDQMSRLTVSKESEINVSGTQQKEVRMTHLSISSNGTPRVSGYTIQVSTARFPS